MWNSKYVNDLEMHRRISFQKFVDTVWNTSIWTFMPADELLAEPINEGKDRYDFDENWQLRIHFSNPIDNGWYHCKMFDVIIKSYALTVVIKEHTLITNNFESDEISAELKNYFSTSKQISKYNFMIDWQYSQKSLCSICGKVGVHRSMGICTIRNVSIRWFQLILKISEVNLLFFPSLSIKIILKKCR